MNKNTRIAKQLIKIAKSLMAGETTTWRVWYLDTWGNEEDGWEVNDRREIFTFKCDSEDEKDIQKAFENALRKHNYKVINFKYEWISENDYGANDPDTGEYLYEFEKD